MRASISLVLVITVACLGPRPGMAQTATSGLMPEQLRPAMLVWQIGTNQPDGPTPMVETVTRATLDGRPTWRVTHYTEDPTTTATNDFDLYDVDPRTLAPLRSVMRNPGLHLELSFDSTAVTLRRRAQADSSTERIRLAHPVMAEGPGMRVFVAGLPLRAGYTLHYYSVDRWDGKNEGRVKRLTLSVTGRRRVATALGDQDVFEVLIRADDGSFRVTQQVRARPPHYPFTTEYVRGATTLRSVVRSMAIEGPGEESLNHLTGPSCEPSTIVE